MICRLLVLVTVFYKLKGVPVLLDMYDLTIVLYKTKFPLKIYCLFFPMLKLVEKISYFIANHLLSITNKCKNHLISKGKLEQPNILEWNPYRFTSKYY